MDVLFVDIIMYFIKYVVTCVLFFVIIPRFVFNYDKEEITKSIVSNYIKMVFWLLTLGYLMVLLKLFELITILAIIAISAFYKYYKKKLAAGTINQELKDEVQILMINHVDRIERIEKKFLLFVSERIERFNFFISSYFGTASSFVNVVILTIIFAFVGYLNFYDPFTNVAPAANESYLTLVWMKAIAHRILFIDNIYPQGFYIFLASLQKFAQIDHLYVINFTGPMNNLLICFGMYFFVSKVNNNKESGIVAAVLYGLLGSIILNPFALKVIANPQQFAVLFLLPTLYYFYSYITYSRRDDFFVAIFGAAIIGLIHPLVFVYLAIGIIMLCLAHFIRDFYNAFYKTFEIFVMMLIATVISLIPLGLGFLLKKPLNSTSFNLLLVTNSALNMPILKLFDYVAISCLLILFLNLLFVTKDKHKFIVKMWIFLFGSSSFILYLLIGVFTKNQYAADSASTLWLFLIPVVVSFGVLTIFDILKAIFRFKQIGYFICVIALIGIFVFIPQKPLVTPKTYYNGSVEQYLRIIKTYRPTQWMIVSSKQLYPLIYGNGFYTSIGDFVHSYNPENEQLINQFDPKAKPLSTQDIFIFYEKNAFDNMANTDYQQYLIELNNKNLLSDWIDKYSASHQNIYPFYNDGNIEIWRIHQEISKEDMKNRIWQQ